MKILGICNGKDSGAALLADGVVVAAANEERFIRKKLTRKFPINAINYVLSVAGFEYNDIDLIGCGAWRGIDMQETLPKLLEEGLALSQKNAFSATKVKERIASTIRSDATARDKLIADFRKHSIPLEKLIWCDHHLSHALVAFYPSPFDNAVVLVADGRGDFRSVSLWQGKREEREYGLRHINTATELTSLGAMYGYITKILGFTPDRHEGKVTGLSAYGKHTELCDLLTESIFFNSETGRIDVKYGDYYLPFLTADLPQLKSYLGKYAKEDFAYAAQMVLENVLCDYLKYFLEKEFDGHSVNLCFSGGCAANVKLNYELSKIPSVKNIYVSPSMGDGGNALGGAINAAVEFGNVKYVSMETVYLGPGYEDDIILKACKDSGLEYRILGTEEKANKIAGLLNAKKIIGWFQGRMEYGPRALGARSILASADDKEINQSLNNRLNRTEFMPFAPVTTNRLAPLCFTDYSEEMPCARFMTICHQCTPLMIEKCPAAVHIDNTARPQVIFENDNPDYFRLVHKYYDLSGRPALINTSFNHHEEPIVMTPNDAIRSYMKGNVDVLVMGNILVGIND